MNSKIICFAASLAVTSQVAQSAIVDDGLWTGNDWYDNTAGFGVTNGVPYSNDANINRRINSALSRDGVDPNWIYAPNVQLVQTFFS